MLRQRSSGSRSRSVLASVWKRLPCALFLSLLAFGLGMGTHGKTGRADELDDDLRVIASAGANAAGSDAARVAAARLKQRGPEALPRLLGALDSSSAVAANWLRTVLDDLVMRHVDRPAADWPVAQLKAYVQDSRHPGRARRWTVQLLERLEPGFTQSWIVLQRDDPEFRGDAVAATIQAGEQFAREKRTEEARQQFRLAFLHGRESDQVLLAARKLREMGEQVDPVARLGFVTRWHLIGPFDAPGTSGFDTTFEPEKAVQLDKVYAVGGSTPVGWKTHETADPLGQVDLIRALAAAREAVGYAYAEIQSSSDVECQLRCSADDNLTVWLNDEKVLARPQWLNGTRLDRFIVPVKLRSGTNRVLVKICQGPQHVDPAVPNNWTFQLRFCDVTGAGLGATIVSPAPASPAAREKTP